ncbi:GPH family glycoside/pentoside/hexuronide:cation symporter [Cryobacterium sp. MP_M5]|uniref:glycoside-pentoside-hexuronide (GPH):cation symporter n=1 Tax=unclassified Cryobacterium TaxID=2649013 RepID=UPI0018C90D0C|nr:MULTISPECIES: glycoside-pentoside-hexuronide (GPH):cation symporter [unclassified Cryobacterium]MBG6058007.1 GPH family glycoside/pentoside/hexuronide:cation symporter [Cryobacterium sp. MP_M3]MEC5176206.1 GPH family glycoside/pentoside/hexuronide:cation symporter [Cryobacterium sp. MP_M5]
MSISKEKRVRTIPGAMGATGPEGTAGVTVIDRISRKEKVAYGFGDFGNGFMFDLGQSYLTKFWIDTAGIAPAVVALIFTLSKLFDAFMDPIAAAFIDSRRFGKRGKFRPVMMVSSILLAVMTVVTFTMPDVEMGWKIAFAATTYAIWGIIYSFTNDPYGSLASVMTRDIKDRAELATTRQAGSLGAQWITGFAFIPMMMIFGGMTARNFMFASMVMAIIGVVSFYVCYRGTKERVYVNRSVGFEKNGVKDYARAVFTNKPLLALVLMTLFTISSMNVNNMMMIFFAQYNLGNIALQAVLNLVMIGASIVGIMFIPKMVAKWGKKKTAMLGFVVSIVANGLNFIIPTNLWTFMILVTIGYAALAIPNGVTWAFVSDTIDYGEWHTGVRKETMTYAAFNFSRKVAQSLAALVGAGMLAITGYVAKATSQSDATLAGIKSVMTLYPAVALTIAAVIIYFLYSLSDKKYHAIAVDLEEGRWENGVIGEEAPAARA